MAVCTIQSRPLQWNMRNIVVAAFEGLHNNRIWEKIINYNNVSSRASLSLKSVMIVSFSICNVFRRAADVLSCTKKMGHIENNFLADHQSLFIAGTGALMALNITAIFKHHTNKNVSEVHSKMDSFLVIVWKATPYLMIVTNIALTIIDIRNNKIVGLVKLAVTGITLLDLTPWKSQSFDWYLDVGVRLPLDIVTLYYDKSYCILIVLGWASTPDIKKIFKSFLAKWA
jgi:hypothetical protein